MFKRENLRKNFLRVKQNIDQNLGRSEKSEVLSEDQQENEKRVDVVKHAFQNISKKSGAVLQAQGNDFDKRLKKLPETGLGHVLQESAQGLTTESLLGFTCHVCGECQGNLARERVQFETVVEQDFIKPMNSIVEVDIPSIIKQRKILNKSILDMDSARSRFNQAVRQSSVPGVNMSNAATKVDGIKDEYDDAIAKVETNKDNLSIELCHFTAKESEHAYLLLGLLEAQANYHRKAMEAIEECIPKLRLAIHNSPAKPCYGLRLEEHLRLTGRDIAVVLEACVLTLFEIGMEEEGLFRVAGSANKLKKLKASFDAFPFDANALDVMVEEYSTDPHAVAGALKQYLRELPEPILTFALHNDFMHAATLPPEQRLTTLWTIINRMPLANYNNFRYLIKFLAKLKDKSDINKMKASNIAIVVGPNLLWSEGSDTPSMITTGNLSTVIDAVVTHADYFFPGAGYDFRATKEGSCPKAPSEPPKLEISPEPLVGIGPGVEKKQSLLEMIQPKPKPKQSSSMENLLSDSRRPQFLIKGQSNAKPISKPGDQSESKSGKNPDESSLTSTSIGSSSSNSSLNKLINQNKGIRERGHTLPTQVSSSSYDTGDYDNIMFTSSSQSPLFRSSTVSTLYPLKDSSNTTSNQDVRNNNNTATSTKSPESSSSQSSGFPTRPSRPSKKMSPVSKLTQNFLRTAGATYSSSPLSSSSLSQSESQALNTGLLYQTRPFRQESTKTMTGSIPNISSSSEAFHQPSSGSGNSNNNNNNIYGGPADLSLSSSYQDTQKPLWNRPNQNRTPSIDSGRSNINEDNKPYMPSSYNSAKRGSAPTIVAPPAATFSQMESHPHASYHRPGPAKISRSQLGQPPAPKNQPQNLSSPPQQQQDLQQQHHQHFDSSKKGFQSFASGSVPSSSSYRPLTNPSHSSAGVAAVRSTKGGPVPLSPPDYSTKVQAMWEDFSNMSANEPASGNNCLRGAGGGLCLPTFVKANESLMKDEEKQRKRMAVVMKDSDLKQVKNITDNNVEDDDAHADRFGVSSTSGSGGVVPVTTKVPMQMMMSTSPLFSSDSTPPLQPQPPPPSSSSPPPPSSSSSSLWSSSSPEHCGDANASCTTATAPSNKQSSRNQQELNFNVSGYEEDHENLGTSQIMNTSAEVPTVQVPSPGSYNQQPVSPKSSSPASLSINISSDGSSDATSPVQRRGTRKPAPPPPPERPFNVMVTATTAVASAPHYTPKPGSDGTGSNNNYSSASDDSANSGASSSLTWPRSAPLASPDSPTADIQSATAAVSATTPTTTVNNNGSNSNTLERQQQHRISGGGGGHTERPNMPPPERPKLPPPVTMPPPGGVKGHQRSASTGAMMNNSNVVEGTEGTAATKPDLDLASDNESDRYIASVHL